MNCEDIAMASMISGITGKGHLAVYDSNALDFGTKKGISTKFGHLDIRSNCLTEISEKLGINPLISNIEVFQPINLSGE